MMVRYFTENSCYFVDERNGARIIQKQLDDGQLIGDRYEILGFYDSKKHVLDLAENRPIRFDGIKLSEHSELKTFLESSPREGYKIVGTRFLESSEMTVVDYPPPLIKTTPISRIQG